MLGPLIRSVRQTHTELTEWRQVAAPQVGQLDLRESRAAEAIE